jgi:hypothetical protein
MWLTAKMVDPPHCYLFHCPNVKSNRGISLPADNIDILCPCRLLLWRWSSSKYDRNVYNYIVLVWMLLCSWIALSFPGDELWDNKFVWNSRERRRQDHPAAATTAGEIINISQMWSTIEYRSLNFPFAKCFSIPSLSREKNIRENGRDSCAKERN